MKNECAVIGAGRRNEKSWESMPGKGVEVFEEALTVHPSIVCALYSLSIESVNELAAKFYNFEKEKFFFVFWWK